MLPIAIDHPDEVRQRHVALIGNPFKALPKIVLKADTGLTTANDIERFMTSDVIPPFL